MGDFLSNLFGTAAGVVNGINAKDAASDAAKTAAANAKAAQANSLSATLQKYTPLLIGGVVVLFGLLLFVRSDK